MANRSSCLPLYQFLSLVPFPLIAVILASCTGPSSGVSNYSGSGGAYTSRPYGSTSYLDEETAGYNSFRPMELTEGYNGNLTGTSPKGERFTLHKSFNSYKGYIDGHEVNIGNVVSGGSYTAKINGSQVPFTVSDSYGLKTYDSSLLGGNTSNSRKKGSKNGIGGYYQHSTFGDDDDDDTYSIHSRASSTYSPYTSTTKKKKSSSYYADSDDDTYASTRNSYSPYLSTTRRKSSSSFSSSNDDTYGTSSGSYKPYRPSSSSSSSRFGSSTSDNYSPYRSSSSSSPFAGSPNDSHSSTGPRYKALY